MSQDRWELKVVHRERQVKLSTLKQELDDYTSLVLNFGMDPGSPVILDFSDDRVPKQQRSRQEEMLTPEEFRELSRRLYDHTEPGADGRLTRTWSLVA